MHAAFYFVEKSFPGYSKHLLSGHQRKANSPRNTLIVVNSDSQIEINARIVPKISKWKTEYS